MSTPAVSQSTRGGLGRRTVLAALAGVGVAGLAGCLYVDARPPVDRPRSVTLTVRNDDDRPRAVTAVFLAGDVSGPVPFEGVRLVHADGTDAVSDVDTFAEIPLADRSDVVAVLPLTGGVTVRLPSLAPGGEVTQQVDDAPGPWVLYTVAAPEAATPFVSAGQVTCAPNGLSEFEVRLLPGTEFEVRLGCRDASA